MPIHGGRAARAGPRGPKLLEEARLADPWLAEERDGAGLATVEVVE